jgi:hypothetical protein
MFQKIATRQIKCTVCKQPIFKGFPCLTAGTPEEHGPTVCIHCLKLAEEIVLGTNEKKEWPFRGWSFLTRKTYNNISTCYLCEKEIIKDEYMWITKYSPEFGGTVTKTEYTCMRCVSKIIAPVSVAEYEDSLIRRFEKKIS